jgi:hypothetical protein
VELTEKQRGVVRGVIPAAVLTLVGLCGVSLLLPTSALPADEPGARVAWALQWSLLPMLTLVGAVARPKAKQRIRVVVLIPGRGNPAPSISRKMKAYPT